MDNSFINYDDFLFNDGLFVDFDLCGDSSFLWQLETEGRDFLQTIASDSVGNIENSNEPTHSENLEFRETTPSDSCTNSNTATDNVSLKKSDADIQLPWVSVSPPESRAEEENKNFKCSLCGKHFAQKSSCNRHNREQHLQPESFHCNKCGLRFSKKFNLQTHQKRAHPKKLNYANNGFKCPNCSCIYSTESAVKKHIKDYHEKGKQLMQNETTTQSLLDEDNDPQREAENVLKQLMRLQKDIEEANIKHTKKTTDELITTTPDTIAEITSIDELVVEQVTISDRLYPFGETKEIKVQQIQRNDGIRYLVCEFCSKEFRKSYDYLRHRRIHNRVRPFICVACKKSFPTQHQLKRHCSTHKLVGNFEIVKGCYKCPKCFENISTISQFDNHLSSHLPQSAVIFKCRTCNKLFQSLSTYFRHKHKAYDPELNMLKSLLPSPLCLVDGSETLSVFNEDTSGNYQCSLCSLKMSSSVSLQQHEKRHKNLRKFQCSLCSGYYASKSSLEVHMKIHLNQRNFKCKKCNKVFRTNYQLKRHGFRHTSIKNYKCRYCNEFFKTAQYCRSHMMGHLKKLIKTKGEFQQQKENIASVQTLIENKDKAEIVITEMQICKNSRSGEKCPKTEQNNISYKCLKCPLQFRYNAWLMKHIAQTHCSERPFKCEICLKTFRKKHVLKTHLLTHEDVRPKETCLVCGKKYASIKSLKVHLRLHTEEKPFNCEICHKLFRTSGQLIQHRKSNHKDDSTSHQREVTELGCEKRLKYTPNYFESYN